jgi:hypothetical protein
VGSEEVAISIWQAPWSPQRNIVVTVKKKQNNFLPGSSEKAVTKEIKGPDFLLGAGGKNLAPGIRPTGCSIHPCLLHRAMPDYSR